MCVVTIDSGTTNTRVRMWKDSRVIADASAGVGIRDVARTNDTGILIREIKRLMGLALSNVAEEAGEIEHIVASGMITSDIGLCHLPHLSTPVTVEQLAGAAEMRLIPEISHIPILFIPGIKNAVSSAQVDNCDAMDMMRGEEVEVFGLLAQQPITGAALIVLPGSHSKLVKLDENRNITGCSTTMVGELLDVLTHQTVLASSLPGGFVKKTDTDYLYRGADLCQKTGITRAGFAVRILDVFTEATEQQRASFLLGVALYSDLQAMKYSAALNLTSDTTIIISGKEVLQNALAKLIKRDPFFTGRLILTDEKHILPLSGAGALQILHIARKRTDIIDTNTTNTMRSL